MTKSPTEISDRRNSLRAKRVLSIQYRISKTRRKNVSRGWQLSTTEDMSLDGLSFYSDLEFKIGEELEVHVVMSGILDIYNGKARIIRVEKKETGNFYLVGVRFNLRKSTTRKAKTYASKRTGKKKAGK